MARRLEDEEKDVELCRAEIQAVLLKYRCRLLSGDESWVYMQDLDTGETVGSLNPL